MNGIKGKHIILHNAFRGAPKAEDFGIYEIELPGIKNEEFIVELKYLTVDPYMRLPQVAKPGKKMGGEGVGIVLQSKNTNYPVGSTVFGTTGWATHAVGDNTYRVIPDGVSNLSHYLGVLGLPGLTAYLEIENCQPNSGDTLFVNAGVGTISSITGQMAKCKGCKVVGCADSDAEVKHLKEIGFDEAFNYKGKPYPHEKLCAAAVDGIDCFIDHVGGEQFNVAMELMNPGSRICLSGAVSNYNLTSPIANYINWPVISKEITVKGLSVYKHYDRFPEFIKETTALINEGKLKVHEHFYEGLETMPDSFIALLAGEHFGGKVIIKL